VSVVIPTYHRPDLLRRAVSSILSQEFGEGEFEVIIAVSDAGSAPDRAAAQALAASDRRVRVVIADRLGPAAARNDAMAVARGDAFAFTDDDCVVQPGWLQAGVDRLAAVDLVQGLTGPAEPRTTRMAKTITVDQLSWNWETCNLFVRQSAVARAGGFDESWQPTGRADRPWGEDAIWGWRLIEAGATYAFEPRAEVCHEVTMRGYREMLTHKLDLRYYPLMLRRCPQMRRRFYAGYFLNRHHMVMTVALGTLVAAGAVAAAGRPRTAALGATAAMVAALSPPRTRPARTLQLTANELIGYGALAFGTLRYRRILL